jgi:HEAT repeat protein
VFQGSIQHRISRGLMAALACAWVLTLAGSAGAADAVPIPLDEIVEITASSELSTGAAYKAVDGRSGSAWIAGWRKGKGSKLTIQFDQARFITMVAILPGNAGSNTKWKKNCVPKTIELQWDKGGSQTFPIRFRRVNQYLMLKEPARTTKLSVVVKDLYDCALRDVAITELMPYEPRNILKRHPELHGRLKADLAEMANPSKREDAMARLIHAGRPAVDYLKRQTGSDDPMVAESALTAMLGISKRKGRGLLRAMLSSGNQVKIAAALRALRWQRLEGLSEILVRLASRDETLVGALAFDALARAGEVQGLPLLEKALRSEDLIRSSIALGALSAYGDRGRELAIKLATHGSERDQLRGLAALSGFTTDETVAAIVIRLTVSPSRLVAQAATRALGQLPSDEARSALADLINSRLSSIRHAAMEALVQQGDAAVPILRRVLQERGRSVATPLFAYMAQSSAPGVLELILESLTSDLEPVWYQDAERALHAYGEAGAEAILAHLVEHPEHASRVGPVLERLAHVASIAAGHTLRSMPPERRLDPVREVILSTLARGGDLRTASIVIGLFRDSGTSDILRRKALVTLGYLPSPEAREEVLRAMSHSDGRIVAIALEAAGLQGESRATPLIMGMLRERSVKEWSPKVIEALGRLQAREALELFRHNLNFASRPAQLAILRACHAIGGRDAMRVLVNASVSSDASVSRLATELLSE